MLVEEGDHAVVQDAGGGERRFARGELGEADLNRLLVDRRAPPLQRADMEGVLRQAVARMLAVEFAMGILVGLGLFVEAAEAMEAVARVAHHAAGPDHATQPLGQLQRAGLPLGRLPLGHRHGGLSSEPAGVPRSAELHDPPPAPPQDDCQIT